MPVVGPALLDKTKEAIKSDVIIIRHIRCQNLFFIIKPNYILRYRDWYLTNESSARTRNLALSRMVDIHVST